ncbi:hypothetical protein ACFE04_021070 [Oxalis oulophora]
MNPVISSLKVSTSTLTLARSLSFWAISTCWSAFTLANTLLCLSATLWEEAIIYSYLGEQLGIARPLERYENVTGSKALKKLANMLLALQGIPWRILSSPSQISPSYLAVSLMMSFYSAKTTTSTSDFVNSAKPLRIVSLFTYIITRSKSSSRPSSASATTKILALLA